LLARVNSTTAVKQFAVDDFYEAVMAVAGQFVSRFSGSGYWCEEMNLSGNFFQARDGER